MRPAPLAHAGFGGADPGSLFPGLAPIRLPPGRPILCTIIDAEEEFHWGRPVSPHNNATASIRHQKRAQDVFACYGVRPTYLVTYPIASDPAAAGVLRDYLADGRCEIGAQLHPWVTPPFRARSSEVGSTSDVNRSFRQKHLERDSVNLTLSRSRGEPEERLSFPGNLEPALEREKLHRLAETVRDSFGIQPTAYKAGRYGFGPSTARLLEDEGFLVDTSLIPRTRYTDLGGPDFAAFDYGPFWFGARRRLLELPVTRALTGGLAGLMPGVYGLAQRQPLRRLRAPALLARTGLLERITLSPEGSDLPAMLRLTRALLKRGERIFTLSYHSPSLAPGNTPYVRDHRDLAIFLDRLSGFLSFFRDELGGVFLTVKELHARLQADPPTESPLRPEPEAPYAIAGSSRCLVVANTFPPVHGGSAIVYDSLGRFGGGRVSVLAPQQDYRSGWPIQGWREFDRQAPFKVHRVRLLRTCLLSDNAGIRQRIFGLAADLIIRLSTLRAISRIVRTENIAVLCIGELVAGGWLAAACGRLFGLKTLIYIHGEEISTRTRYDQGGQRRRRALAAAHGIVAVSRFTRQMLIEDFGVPAEKIELVSNGVDLARFTPRPRPAHLVARYGLDGRPVLLTISRLYARKGIDRVIESLPAIVRQQPDIVYLIVGEGSYRPTLENLVAIHGLGRNVVFAGAVPDYELADHYSLGDVFIMANRQMPDGETEGFGLVFLEANACGLPVIAGRAGGSVDAVTDQRNGLLVEGDDPAAIARAVNRMFSDNSLRRRLQAGGTEIAHASGWDRRVEQFLQFCDSLTDRRG